MKKFKEIITEMSDEDNPKYMFQTMPTKLVLQVALGKLNAKEYAKHEMENRGFDKKGKWIGFDKSEQLWKSKTK